jgi:hypothetical protein
MAWRRTIVLTVVLSLFSFSLGVAQSIGSAVPPTKHQIRHGMKPGHHGSPATSKHRSRTGE